MKKIKKTAVTAVIAVFIKAKKLIIKYHTLDKIVIY